MTPVTANLARPSSSADRTIETEMLDFLQAALRFPSVSGEEQEFVEFVADWGRRQGLSADVWQSDEASLGPEYSRFSRHLPLAGRPTLVLSLPGDSDLPSLIFNAHADVVPAEAAAWSHDPWSGDHVDGRVIGRGACDVKGPLVSALWAMLRVAEQPAQRGNVFLELVPGEEDCVGLGTLTSVKRNWHADAAIVLEPTEQLPRCASRGGCRFEIDLFGRSIHGTLKWLGNDAIKATWDVTSILAEIEAQFNRLDGDELFASYPILRPITVDFVRGGKWQGMVCDHCTCAGYFELLPNDNVDEWKDRFVAETQYRWQARGGRPDQIQIRFIEEYQGHRLDARHAMCRCAEEAVHVEAGPEPFHWQGFNSGCEAGLRANLTNTPTLVWGPGSLAQAHAVDEYVEWDDVRRVAFMLTDFIHHWARS